MDGLEGFSEVFPGVYYRVGQVGRKSEVRIMGVRLDLVPPGDRRSLFSEAVKDKLLPLLDHWSWLYRPAYIKNAVLEVSPDVGRHFRLIEPPDWNSYETTFCRIKVVEVDYGGPLVQLVSKPPRCSTRLEVIVSDPRRRDEAS